MCSAMQAEDAIRCRAAEAAASTAAHSRAHTTGLAGLFVGDGSQQIADWYPGMRSPLPACGESSWGARHCFLCNAHGYRRAGRNAD
jgi:hypothetical protein